MAYQNTVLYTSFPFTFFDYKIIEIHNKDFSLFVYS